MKQYYIKTSSRYLIPSIILLAVIAILIGIDTARGERQAIFFLENYVTFVSLVFV